MSRFHPPSPEEELEPESEPARYFNQAAIGLKVLYERALESGEATESLKLVAELITKLAIKSTESK